MSMTSQQEADYRALVARWDGFFGPLKAEECEEVFQALDDTRALVGVLAEALDQIKAGTWPVVNENRWSVADYIDSILAVTPESAGQERAALRDVLKGAVIVSLQNPEVTDVPGLYLLNDAIAKCKALGVEA